jgi:hypothetical protein
MIPGVCLNLLSGIIFKITGKLYLPIPIYSLPHARLRNKQGLVECNENKFMNEILDSYGGEDVDVGLLCCKAV